MKHRIWYRQVGGHRLAWVSSSNSEWVPWLLYPSSGQMLVETGTYEHPHPSPRSSVPKTILEYCMENHYVDRGYWATDIWHCSHRILQPRFLRQALDYPRLVVEVIGFYSLTHIHEGIFPYNTFLIPVRKRHTVTVVEFGFGDGSRISRCWDTRFCCGLFLTSWIRCHTKHFFFEKTKYFLISGQKTLSEQNKSKLLFTLMASNFSSKNFSPPLLHYVTVRLLIKICWDSTRYNIPAP